MLSAALKKPVANANYLGIQFKGTRFETRYIKLLAGNNLPELKGISETASKRVGLATSGRLLAHSIGWVTVGYTVIDTGVNWHSRSNSEKIRAGADVTMTLIGMYGGPWGAGASLVYFGGIMIYDYTTQ